jgi:hypothetical protein
MLCGECIKFDKGECVGMSDGFSPPCGKALAEAAKNHAPLGQAEFDCSMAKRVYTQEQLAQINELLPPNILKEINRVGWNVFGIYELCEEVLTVEP